MGKVCKERDLAVALATTTALNIGTFKPIEILLNDYDVELEDDWLEGLELLFTYCWKLAKEGEKGAAMALLAYELATILDVASGEDREPCERLDALEEAFEELARLFS